MTAAGRAAAQSAGATELPEINVQGQGGGQSSNPNSPLAADGYVAQSSAAGSKTKTPLVEIPQSISTVTRQQLEDRNVQTLSDALTYTPGVRIGAFGFDPRFDSFYVRGFDATYSGIYRDGLREQNAPFAIFKTEPYGLDGVSVLKGPASALYGGGSPGGIIDLTTKRPTFEPFGEIEGQIGNHDRYQGQFDVGGPIGDAGTLAYRVTGVLRDSDTNLMGTPDNKVFIAPAFTWKPDEDTKFTFLSEYSHIKTGANAAFYNDFSGSKPRVTHLFSGDPAWNDFKQDQARVGYEFEHKFTPDVTFRQNFRYSHIDTDARYVDIDTLERNDAGQLVASRYAGRVTDKLDSAALDNQVEAKIATGPLAHTLLAGFDLQYAKYSDKTGLNSDTVPPLIFGEPGHDYGDQPISSPNDDNVGRQKQRQLGLYAQDQIRFGQFVATLGLREDWVRTSTRTKTRDDLDGTSADTQSDHKLTGRAGLTYLGPFGINPYVSYSTSYSPEVGYASTLDENGNQTSVRPFKPTTAEQIEAGVKYAPPGYNAVITAAVFEIIQKNAIRSVGNFSVQDDKVRSRGFEFEATAGLSNGLSLTAAYTHLDIEFDGKDNPLKGNDLSGVPNDSASFWANYDFKPGSALFGFGIGAGVRFIGKSYGDDENTFRNDAVRLLDAAVKFDFERVDPRMKGLLLQVNARNLANKDVATCQAGYCYRDEGRQVIASLRYRW